MIARRFAVLALCALAAPATPARALPAPVPHQVLAVPSAFVLPEVTIFRGDTLTLTNVDPRFAHDLTSRNFKPGTGTRLFSSGSVDPGAQASVAGVSSLAPGVYPFYCLSHEEMIGNLRVQTAPAR